MPEATNLHATPAYPDEVASPRSLTFFVGNPPRQMQIFSGIAIPNWDSQELLDFKDVLVHFNVPAPDGNFPDDWEYTATASLAHIDASGDNDFTFLTEECQVLKDENTGELLLYVKIAVLGSPAHLVRFSYHVEVLSKVPVQGSIFGTIRWNSAFGDLGGGPMFKVGPATFVAAGLGGGGFTGWVWDDQFTIETPEHPKHVGNMWLVPYSITGLPLNRDLNIRPDLLPGTLIGLPAGFDPNPAFAPISYPVTLTPSAPAAVGIDFEMTFSASRPA
jgi:hypothetical protein